jgi:hypothetical protein
MIYNIAVYAFAAAAAFGAIGLLRDSLRKPIE